eukprot:CAMPEP_0119503334 /NCGR_PEP_ID=MMETSP1344-20130328/24535_1 /TAXON_ID=236787 /ORGANISM="Florenciella parvula, Strain CCMP2471" /LENGTH=365 /DNA_ID=CAMNT_0007539619 /DNA_START=171 /DNA_END=1264 /DNA_ORIENTATION=-
MTHGTATAGLCAQGLRTARAAVRSVPSGLAALRYMYAPGQGAGGSPGGQGPSAGPSGLARGRGCVSLAPPSPRPDSLSGLSSARLLLQPGIHLHRHFLGRLVSPLSALPFVVLHVIKVLPQHRVLLYDARQLTGELFDRALLGARGQSLSHRLKVLLGKFKELAHTVLRLEKSPHKRPLEHSAALQQFSAAAMITSAELSAPPVMSWSYFSSAALRFSSANLSAAVVVLAALEVEHKAAVVREDLATRVDPRLGGRRVAVVDMVRRWLVLDATPVPALPAPVRLALGALNIHASTDLGRWHAALRVGTDLDVVELGHLAVDPLLFLNLAVPRPVFCTRNRGVRVAPARKAEVVALAANHAYRLTP